MSTLKRWFNALFPCCDVCSRRLWRRGYRLPHNNFCSHGCLLSYNGRGRPFGRDSSQERTIACVAPVAAIPPP